MVRRSGRVVARTKPRRVLYFFGPIDRNSVQLLSKTVEDQREDVVLVVLPSGFTAQNICGTPKVSFQLLLCEFSHMRRGPLSPFVLIAEISRLPGRSVSKERA
jgi:hypothetical protein